MLMMCCIKLAAERLPVQLQKKIKKEGKKEKEKKKEKSLSKLYLKRL